MISNEMISQIKEITDLALKQESEKSDKRNTDSFPVQSVMKKLKEAFPDLLVRMEDDDNIIGTDPVYTCDLWSLYFIDTSDHCQTLTKDQESASGILIGYIV